MDTVVVGAASFIRLAIGTPVWLNARRGFGDRRPVDRVAAGRGDDPDIERCQQVLAVGDTVLRLGRGHHGEGGIASRLIAFASIFVGFIRGGLSLVNMLASEPLWRDLRLVRGGTASIGSVMIPQMEKGDPRRLLVRGHRFRLGAGDADSAQPQHRDLFPRLGRCLDRGFVHRGRRCRVCCSA